MIFPVGFPGTNITLAPLPPVKKLASKAQLEYKEFFQQLYEPVSTNLSQLIQKTKAEAKISCKYVDMSTFPATENRHCLWIKYCLDAPGLIKFFMIQCITNELLSSLYRHFLKKEITSDFFSKPEKLLNYVRALNKRYQERLVDTITTSGIGKVGLGSNIPTKGRPVYLNLEELRLSDDRTIRAVLEELSRRRFPLKSLVFALTGMSEELRERFLNNMSRNRRVEVNEGFSFWEGTNNEVLQAHRDLAWAIIDMAEEGKIKVHKRLQSQLEAIMRAMDTALRYTALKYIKSNRFGTSISAINDILLQVLFRRVPRKVLIPALSELKDETYKKICANMTSHAVRLLNDDIEHWQRNARDETEKLTSTAAAQQAIIKTAVKLKSEFVRSAF
ncbi:hypothetical protein AMJ80_01550 [bacterium SM23_31]|nr:MAG: hypothetical protein AMJ80_01550 [bacterium SM23_31]